ncbi:MAG: glycosyltransferase [Elusimicrobiota bacterium]
MRPSFLVLTYRRASELLACLDSLERDGAREKAEVIVGLNDDPAGNEAAAALLRDRHPWVRVLPLARCGRGEARNRLAAAARGDVFYFLDDDTIAPAGFIDRARAAFELHPQAAAIGGPNVGPPDASAFSRAVDFLLRSPLGAGPMRVRHLRTGAERRAPSWAFTLSNLGVRRAAFEKGFRFPANAASAEETLFLHALERGGLATFQAPALYILHRRRAGWKSFLRQTFSCGLGRAQITRAAPSSLHPAALVPAASFAGAAVLLLVSPPALIVLASLYAAACLFEAARMALGERDLAAAYLPALFPLAHAAYALGTAAGALAWPASDAAFEPRLSWNPRPLDG